MLMLDSSKDVAIAFYFGNCPFTLVPNVLMLIELFVMFYSFLIY